ncbi:MAG TPA: O-antigen ligase family protein [Solirubrobacterales bacterium]|nr:O-antigen ligase family protein [Solirubrobacterales bacterium]
MAERVRIEDRWPLLLLPFLPIAVAGLAADGAPGHLLGAVALAGALVIGALYLTAFIDVAWIFSAAIALTIFSGSWRELGFPSLVSPDRLLLIVAFVVFLLRDPALGRRPYVRLTPTHAVLIFGAAFALCSTIAAGTISQSSALAPLVDRFGLIPLMLFVAGPVVFAGEHQRRILLGTLMAVGAYLGLTALFEGVGLHQLVFPRYIVDLNPEVQVGRARGPFEAAAVNGVALYCCAVASVIAYVTIPRRGVRALALAIAALCLFDLIFTQERSVWVGAVAATLAACLAAPQLRRRLPVIVLAVAFGVLGAFAFVPGLQQQTVERIGDHETEWDRLNLNKAAENMIRDRPLFGFGLGTFQQRSAPYFELNPEFPLTATRGELHNIVLSYAVELGLVGVFIWLLGLALAVGGAIVTRGPPELYPWRIGLIAVTVIWLIVANLVPMVQPFPNYLLWLWAGVVWPWRYACVEPETEPEPAREPLPGPRKPSLAGAING